MIYALVHETQKILKQWKIGNQNNSLHDMFGEFLRQPNPRHLVWKSSLVSQPTIQSVYSPC